MTTDNNKTDIKSMPQKKSQLTPHQIPPITPLTLKNKTTL
jgi:hypothetical protein